MDDIGRVDGWIEGRMMIHNVMPAHEYHLKKNYMERVGTWGSNPGPRDYQLDALPIGLNALLVY